MRSHSYRIVTCLLASEANSSHQIIESLLANRLYMMFRNVARLHARKAFVRADIFPASPLTSVWIYATTTELLHAY